MSSFFDSVGFPYSGTKELARLCMHTKQEGEIITTSVGTYYRMGVPIPDTDEYEIELWFKETHAGDFVALNSHFLGATSGNANLIAALQDIKGQYYDGAYRFTFGPRLCIGAQVMPMPLVFACPNFDCGENFVLPQTARFSLCAIGATLTCYEDEADYLARSKGPPPSYIFSIDFVRDEELYPEPVSSIAHITGRVEETEIMTNPITDCDFTWAVIDVGMLGLIDVVAAPAGLNGFMHEGSVVRGTAFMSGRLLEW